MKIINLKDLEIDVYEEELKNGLKIYMIPYDNKKEYFISYATRFGSDVLGVIDKDLEFIPPTGIAHFLEHKMFEEENGIDPFTFFSESGTDSNASTSFDNTQYICSGTKNFENNLRYLIQYVNKPYFTDENVNKEKGIIIEEIKMYQDIPDAKLEMELRKSVYHKHPRRNDIAGSINDVKKITKEDLYKMYNYFYVPNNMFILIVGNFNKDNAFKIIKEELENKSKKNLPKIKEIKEDNKVYKKEYKLEENIEIPKIGIGLKVPTKNIKRNELELDLYLSALTNIMFGSSSEFRERTRRNKSLNGIYTEWESTKDLKVFYLMASTTKKEELIQEIKYELENISISEKNFNRLKKVWIANEIKMIDNINRTIYNMYDDILSYNEIIPNKVEIIRNMKVEELNKIIKEINFKNISIVEMNTKKEESE